ncbi:hypothetical protein [Amorphus sp. 3PC139-8]|uniref:hypothetical protein n=1 Tax=Amorphus sp. 3PC139-8 TaxID=2735676 RepID=UPI00345D2945
MSTVARYLTSACLGIAIAIAVGHAGQAQECDVDAVAGELRSAIRTTLDTLSERMAKQDLVARLKTLETDPKARSEFMYGFRRSFPACSDAEAEKALDLAVAAMKDDLADQPN